MADRIRQLAHQRGLLQTPAFVVDERRLDANVAAAIAAVRGERTRLLFAMKSFSIRSGLVRIARGLDGLHVSSLFEARLAREVVGPQGLVHLTTPSMRSEELEELCSLCDYISFNSLSQWEMCKDRIQGDVACGLRVNPQLSLLTDARYDPCRRGSKLGAPLDQLAEIVRATPSRLEGIDGLLVHTNCDATDFEPLVQTVHRLESRLAPLLERATWINLGGGYLFDEASDFAPLRETIDHLRSRYDAELLFEPGAAISRAAGYIVSEVLDVFESDGTSVAVLDTSVNHMPEVFEYQFAPEVLDTTDGGRYRYLLAGATCLAGDLFGQYTFEAPLRPGSRIVFEEVGAYTMVKASMFNGVNLPSIYRLTPEGEIALDKTFTYTDYLSHCGAD